MSAASAAVAAAKRADNKAGGSFLEAMLAAEQTHHKTASGIARSSGGGSLSGLLASDASVDRAPTQIKVRAEQMHARLSIPSNKCIVLSISWCAPAQTADHADKHMGCLAAMLGAGSLSRRCTLNIAVIQCLKGYT